MKPLEEKQLRDIAREIRDKASLEHSLLPSVRANMDGIATAFRRSFAQTGMAPNLTPIRERLAQRLARHYRTTSRRFADTVFAQIGSAPEGAAALRDRGLAAWIEERSRLQAFAIVTTSERRMPSVVSRATQTLQAEEKPVTNAAIAVTAANLLRLNGRQRAPSIASFETQVAAETTKRISAEAAGGRVPFSLALRDPSATPVDTPAPVNTKAWQTEEDSVVRDSHVAANGQIVSIDQPFIVGGETLFFPGDTSRGATLGNVIGCRCASIYRAGDLS